MPLGMGEAYCSLDSKSKNAVNTVDITSKPICVFLWQVLDFNHYSSGGLMDGCNAFECVHSYESGFDHASSLTESLLGDLNHAVSLFMSHIVVEDYMKK